MEALSGNSPILHEDLVEGNPQRGRGLTLMRRDLSDVAQDFEIPGASTSFSSERKSSMVFAMTSSPTLAFLASTDLASSTRMRYRVRSARLCFARRFGVRGLSPRDARQETCN